MHICKPCDLHGGKAAAAEYQCPKEPEYLWQQHVRDCPTQQRIAKAMGGLT